MLHTFETAEKFTERKEHRQKLMMEMQRRSELSTYLCESGGVFHHPEPEKQDSAIMCAPPPNRRTFAALASARKLISDEHADDDDKSFVFTDNEGNYSGFRANPYRAEQGLQLNLQEIHLGGDAEDNRERSTHGGVLTSIWTIYHDNVRISKRTYYMILAAFATIVIIAVTASAHRNNRPAATPDLNNLGPSAMNPLDPSVPSLENDGTNISTLVSTLLINLHLVSVAHLDDKTSAQYRAIDFLAQTETAKSLGSFEITASEWTSDPVIRPFVEAYALAVLYFSTNGQKWEKSDGWTDPALSPCKFQGVLCTKMDLSAPFVDAGVTATTIVKEEFVADVITNITLFANGLEGPIPTELGVLLALQVLDLETNRLVGDIPSALSSLQRLKELYLSENNLKGHVPEAVVGGLGELSVLSLYDNALSGTIPRNIGDAVNLQILLLGNNNFSGVIPGGIGALTHLQFLRIGNNHLVGNIPDSISNIHGLWVLDLAENKLTGTIPSTLSKLTTLVELHLYGNKIGGTIPEHLEAWSYLTVFSVDLNELVGTIPESLMSLTDLHDLQLSRNKLTGSLPESIGGLTKLEFLRARQNALGGKLPDSLGNLVNLQSLHLDQNQFTGAVPEGMSQLTSLLTLELHSNSITGSVPQSVCTLVLDSHLTSLTADCNSEITCDCCTTCF
jgi:Leucine-rich repeat (LRR) protein